MSRVLWKNKGITTSFGYTEEAFREKAELDLDFEA